MITLGQFELNEVIPFISDNPRRQVHRFITPQGTFQVDVSSNRLKLFKTSVQCVACQRMGAYFLLQLCPGQKSPHFNLYTANGILMTKDHILPVSKGGQNGMSNLQVMCWPCNQKKGNTYASLPPQLLVPRN